MTIKPVQKLVSSSKYNVKCPYSMTAQYITFHNTANDANAESEVKYMVSNNNEVSFHFAVDDKEVIQGLPVNRNAWHCGDGRGKGNMNSIGIEVCYSKSGGERYKKAEALAIKFIAQLLHERKWNVDRVKPHKYWTQIGVKNGNSSYIKNCPHRILDEGRWNQVLSAIESELNKLNGIEKKTTKPATSNGITNIKGEKYYTINPKKIELLSDRKIYKTPACRENESVGEFPKGTVFTIVAVVKNTNGVPRLKTKSGYYITANVKCVKKV